MVINPLESWWGCAWWREVHPQRLEEGSCVSHAEESSGVVKSGIKKIWRNCQGELQLGPKEIERMSKWKCNLKCKIQTEIKAISMKHQEYSVSIAGQESTKNCLCFEPIVSVFLEEKFWFLLRSYSELWSCVVLGEEHQQLQASRSISWNLPFLICKMGVRVASIWSQWIVERLKRDNVPNIL